MKKHKELINKVVNRTIEYFKDTWSDNYKKNKKTIKKGKWLSDIKPSGKKKAVVIGLHYQFKYDDLHLLRKFKGDIICTNETLRILLEAGVVPSWCVAVDASKIIYNFFDKDIIREKAKKMNIFLPVTINHKVALLAQKYFKNVYWFSAWVPDELVPYLGDDSYIIEKETSLTGGCCGSTAYVLAYYLGVKEIGVRGFGWITEANPREDQTYMLSLARLVKALKDSGIITFDLIPNGRLFMLSEAELCSLEEFVKK